MIKKLKNMLGIESVKIELEIPQEIEKKDQNINGTIILTTLSDAEVKSISIKLIEKYSRGRKQHPQHVKQLEGKLSWYQTPRARPQYLTQWECPVLAQVARQQGASASPHKQHKDSTPIASSWIPHGHV